MPDSKPQPSLVIHHVGGRAGGTGFAGSEIFDKETCYVLYDADADCIEHTSTAMPTGTIVLPYCIGGSTGPAVFNITYDPYGSSLLKFNPEFGEYYYASGACDGTWGEALRTVEQRPMPMTSLDDLVSSGKLNAPPPDFLSIDTQGSEFEIIQGAKGVIKENVVGVVTEWSLEPVYAGQKLLGEVTKELNELGFRFSRFTVLSNQNLYRAPIGLRSHGSQVHGDALFLRQPETLLAEPNLTIRFLRLQKLAFVALVFDQIDFALKCLAIARTACKELGPNPLTGIRAPSELPKYLNFLAEFEEAARQHFAFYPRTFFERYTEQESRERFSVAGDRWSSLEKRDRYCRDLWKRLPEIQKHLKVDATPVEALMIRYGLSSQAETLKRYRLEHVAELERAIANEWVNFPQVDVNTEETARALAQAGATPFSAEAGRIDFWERANDARLVSASPFTLDAVGFDPSVTSKPIALNPSGIRYLVVKMAAKSVQECAWAQLYWAGMGGGFSEPQSVKFPVKCDGEPHTYVVDLWTSDVGGRGVWPAQGSISGLRFDPLNCKGTIELSTLGFLPDKTGQ